MLYLNIMKRFRDLAPAAKAGLAFVGMSLGMNSVTGAFMLPKYIEEVHMRDDSNLQACVNQYPLSTSRAIVFEASEVGNDKMDGAYKKAVGEAKEWVVLNNKREAERTSLFIAASVGMLTAPAILQDEIGRADVGLNDVACSLQGGRVRVLDLPRN
jgi:hypothetical protein